MHSQCIFISLATETVNPLRLSRANTMLSTEEFLNGVSDYDKILMSLPACKVLVYEKHATEVRRALMLSTDGVHALILIIIDTISSAFPKQE